VTKLGHKKFVRLLEFFREHNDRTLFAMHGVATECRLLSLAFLVCGKAASKARLTISLKDTSGRLASIRRCCRRVAYWRQIGLSARNT
jgi:hypothetical protein